jgi:cation transport ATPase
VGLLAAVHFRGVVAGLKFAAVFILIVFVAGLPFLAVGAVSQLFSRKRTVDVKTCRIIAAGLVAVECFFVQKPETWSMFAQTAATLLLQLYVLSM